MMMTGEDEPAMLEASAPAEANYELPENDGNHESDYVILHGSHIPFKEGNAKDGDIASLVAMVNGDNQLSTSWSSWSWCWFLPVFGCCYIATRSYLVQHHQIGIVRDNGRIHILFPGWHRITSPLVEWLGRVPLSQDEIAFPPVNIIRVHQGTVGIATNKSTVEVLLPGLHVRTDPSFVLKGRRKLTDKLIQESPISIFTVSSGFVRLCSNRGIIEILPAGRYAVNSPNYVVHEKELSVRQQSQSFSEQNVLLKGGIRMRVAGLLTYFIRCPKTFVQRMSQDELKEAIENTIEAELANAFSTVHLEQNVDPTVKAVPVPHHSKLSESETKDAVLGGCTIPAEPGTESSQRSAICEAVKKHMEPLFSGWGIEIVQLQIKNMVLANDEYAKEYERQSLAVASAKASGRTQEAKNYTLISATEAEVKAGTLRANLAREMAVLEARGRAEALRIEADAQVYSIVEKAKASALAAEEEGKGRHAAAAAMHDPFAKTIALGDQEIAKAQVFRNLNQLMVLPSTDLCRLGLPAFASPTKS